MEFDYWCNGEEDYNACIHLRLVYADEEWAEIRIATENEVTWNYRKPQGDFVDGTFAFDGKIENMDSWNHFALSFNKRAMKIYINGTRVANIPNCEAPKYFTIGGESWDDHRYFLTNFRVAKGAVPLYDRVMTDGKIVTYAITFDTGKSNVKPESMTEIARIVKLMKDNPAINFEIQGHCDNTGSAATNDRLSQQRAEAIMKKLVEQGIDASRLTAVGKGSKVPIADNSTDEGRALNRRVEFVKK